MAMLRQLTTHSNFTLIPLVANTYSNSLNSSLPHIGSPFGSHERTFPVRPSNAAWQFLGPKHFAIPYALLTDTELLCSSQAIWMISTVSILPLSLRSRTSSCRCEVEIASVKEENRTDASFPSQVVALTNTGLIA